MAQVQGPEFELRNFGEMSGMGYRRQAFMFDTVAVTVNHHCIYASDGDEVGVRVEVQQLEATPGATESDAFELRLHGPLFRADLFSLSTGGPDNMDRAHYHPYFEGRDPGDRLFEPEIVEDPMGWLSGKLSDLPALLRTSRHPELVDEADAARVAESTPSIVAVVSEYLEEVPRPTG